MGMESNTKLEAEILVLAHKIDELIIVLNGGSEQVYNLRVKKNKNLRP